MIPAQDDERPLRIPSNHNDNQLVDVAFPTRRRPSALRLRTMPAGHQARLPLTWGERGWLAIWAWGRRTVRAAGLRLPVACSVGVGERGKMVLMSDGPPTRRR